MDCIIVLFMLLEGGLLIVSTFKSIIVGILFIACNVFLISIIT